MALLNSRKKRNANRGKFYGVLAGDRLQRMTEDGWVQRESVSKTATATLTVAEVENTIITATHASADIALTLPTSGVTTGATCIVCCGGGADVTITATGGFGDVGTGGDVAKLTQGEAACLVFDGSEWYYIGGEAVE